jgi:hypothetical protein
MARAAFVALPPAECRTDDVLTTSESESQSSKLRVRCRAGVGPQQSRGRVVFGADTTM